MPTTDPLDALLALRDGYTTARWNFYDAVGTSFSAPGGIGHAASLSYSFLSAVPSYFSTGGFRAFNGNEQTAARDALAMFSSIARVDFAEVGGVGTMTFGMNSQSGTSGYAYYPSFSYGYDGGGLITSVTAADLAGDVWLDSSTAWTAADFSAGGWGYGTLIHEIGHALGLKHPFDSDNGGATLAASLDSKQWTVMSYDEHPHGLFRTVTSTGGGSYSWRYEYIQPETLMPLDIVALQYLYGANASFHAGKDVYTFDPSTPFIKTIYDTGGSDTISVANFALGCTIDLRDGHFSSIHILSDVLPNGVTETHTDIYDGTDNLAIAYDTVIENATGGPSADTLTGNAVANVLNGGGGADTMTGGAGSDTYYVNHTGDQAIETDAVRATGGTDTVWSYLGTCTLGSNIENGRILRSGNATLNGNALNNVLGSGSGDSVLRGGAGIDTADYGRATAAVTVNLALTAAQATGGSGTDTLTTIENLTGSAYADALTGNLAANTLNGGNGADTLSGGGGADLLSGGAGADRLTGGSGVDVFMLSSLSGSDTLTDFASASDRLRIVQSGIRIGDGDTSVEGVTTIAGPGGFTAAAELVVVTADIGSGLSAANAAAAIGSASGAYAVGRTALFMVNDGGSSALFRFTAAGADAAVSAAELTLLATLSGTAATVAADLIFTA